VVDRVDVDSRDDEVVPFCLPCIRSIACRWYAEWLASRQSCVYFTCSDIAMCQLSS